MKKKLPKRSGEENKPLLDPKMLELIVCPQTKSSLEYDENAQELVSKKAKLTYPVRDGSPYSWLQKPALWMIDSMGFGQYKQWQ